MALLLVRVGLLIARQADAATSLNQFLDVLIGAFIGAVGLNPGNPRPPQPPQPPEPPQEKP